jgi:adenosylmethionine-8-amino-7-oxononanoate aminotransferase
VIFPAAGYLQRVDDICREHEVLLVLDEVITGFGRTGRLFGAETFDVSPDMLLMAKGITSGYAPLGGVMIAPRVWGPFFHSPEAPIFRHGVTYSGHATACAVAQANLDVIEEEELVARVASLIPDLQRLVAPLGEHPLVEEVRTGQGLLAGVQLKPDVPGEELARRCIDQGILFRVITGNTVQISPPFIVETGDLEQIAETLQSVLDALAG